MGTHGKSFCPHFSPSLFALKFSVRRASPFLQREEGSPSSSFLWALFGRDSPFFSRSFLPTFFFWVFLFGSVLLMSAFRSEGLEAFFLLFSTFFFLPRFSTLPPLYVVLIEAFYALLPGNHPPSGCDQDFPLVGGFFSFFFFLISPPPYPFLNPWSFSFSFFPLPISLTGLRHPPDLQPRWPLPPPRVVKIFFWPIFFFSFSFFLLEVTL